MPIEFSCSGCQKKLRVEITAAGKRAQCPDCGTVTQVPQSFTASPPAVPATPDNSQWSTANWSTGPDDSSSDSDANPFSAPTSGYEGLHSLNIVEEARNQVAAPAMCLIVMGSIVCALSAPFSMLALFGAIIELKRDPAEAAGALLLTGFAIGRPALIIYGGIQMRKLQRYPFAIAAGIFAIISFCSCFIEMAFGIWALVVLSRKNVRRAFDELKV